MKSHIALGLLSILLIGCGESAPKTPVAAKPEKSEKLATTEGAPAATPVAFNVEGAPTVEFSVPDMVCEFSCVPQVRETLAGQPGVKDVKVVLDTHTATVAVDKDKFDADKAIAALVDLKFTNTKLAKAADGSKADAAPTAPAAPKS
jgi:copper chaperone CopZ